MTDAKRMTPEERAQAALELYNSKDAPYVPLNRVIADAIRQAQAEMREACARMVDESYKYVPKHREVLTEFREALAQAIRGQDAD